MIPAGSEEGRSRTTTNVFVLIIPRHIPVSWVDSFDVVGVAPEGEDVPHRAVVAERARKAMAIFSRPLACDAFDMG